MLNVFIAPQHTIQAAAIDSNCVAPYAAISPAALTTPACCGGFACVGAFMHVFRYGLFPNTAKRQTSTASPKKAMQRARLGFFSRRLFWHFGLSFAIWGTRRFACRPTRQDITRRIDTFPELFAKLDALGGRWAARDVVIEHTLQDIVV